MREKIIERETAAIGNESGWEEVVRRRRRQTHGGEGRLDVATNAWKFSLKDTVSFYFTEIPDDHGAREMLRGFQFYGDVMEVVIPPKRDKWGKRFGFVRFSNVEDPRLFAIKLDNIIIGSKKIHVNIPRFRREEFRNANLYQRHQARKPKEGETLRRTEELRNKNDMTTRRFHEESRQFRQIQQPRVHQVWRKKDGDIEGGRKVDAPKEQNWQRTASHKEKIVADVCYNVPEEVMKKFRKMVVGTVRTPGSTYAVQEWFNTQGFFSVKITPLGANKVLVEEMEEGVLEVLMNEYKDWLLEKFEVVKEWDPESFDNERVVWVRCHGVPAHAWNNDFFALLVQHFGEYLGVDEATRVKSNMDVARIRFRTKGFDVFNAIVPAKINGSLFNIKMVEEWCGPLQWLDNSCCKRNIEPDTRSESDDGKDDVPTLSMEGGNWYDAENGDDEDEDPENMKENLFGLDEESFVQETIGIFGETMFNDRAIIGEKTPDDNVGMGNGLQRDGVLLKRGEENPIIVEGARGGLVNGNSNGERKGNQYHSSIQKSGGVNVEEVVAGQSGMNKVVGCEQHVDGSINVEEEVGKEKEGAERKGVSLKTMMNKRKMGRGPLRRKLSEKRKKKKRITKQEGVQHGENSGRNGASKDHTASASVSPQTQGGVVRNPIGEFQPSSSMSASSNAFGSHVESIGDSGILMGNNRFETEMEKVKAAKLWQLATDKLGVSVDEGEEEMFIERLQALEERAKAEKCLKGKRKCSK